MPLEESKKGKDESVAMIVKGFKRMFQKHLEFKGIGKGSTSRRNDQHSKGKFISKINTNQNFCYGWWTFRSHDKGLSKHQKEK